MDIIGIVYKDGEINMDTCKLDLYVPSKNNLFLFKEINTHQQRLIGKASAISNDIYCTEFLSELLNTVQDNCKLLNVNELNIHDLLIILIGLRASSVGTDIPLSIVCNKCNAEHKFTLKINEIYSNICKINPLKISVEDEEYIFNISVPNVKKELDLMYKLKVIAFTDAPEAIKNSFILNLDRYVNEVKDKKSNSYVEFNDSQKYKFYSALPMDTINKILVAIQKIQINYKIFDFICEVEKCDKKLYRTLNYDLDKFYFVIKLIFNESIVDTFKDMFYLQKIGIPLNYADQLTYLERQVIWSFFDELESKKNDVARNTSKLDPLPMMAPTFQQSLPEIVE